MQPKEGKNITLLCTIVTEEYLQGTEAKRAAQLDKLMPRNDTIKRSLISAYKDNIPVREVLETTMSVLANPAGEPYRKHDNVQLVRLMDECLSWQTYKTQDGRWCGVYNDGAFSNSLMDVAQCIRKMGAGDNRRPRTECAAYFEKYAREGTVLKPGEKPSALLACILDNWDILYGSRSTYYVLKEIAKLTDMPRENLTDLRKTLQRVCGDWPSKREQQRKEKWESGRQQRKMPKRAKHK